MEDTEREAMQEEIDNLKETIGEKDEYINEILGVLGEIKGLTRGF